MNTEEKYKFAVKVLQAIAQRSGANKYGFNEWTESEAFRDCKRAAQKCLLRLNESLTLHN